MLPYVCIGIVLIVFWILNIAVSAPIQKIGGSGCPHFKKCVSNGNSILFCFVGLIAIAIAANFLDFLKWIIIVYFGVFGLICLIQVVISIVTSIVATLTKSNYVHFIDWLLIASNFIAMVCDLLIAISTFCLLF